MRISDWSSDVCSSDLTSVSIREASIRGRLLWEPSPDVAINLIADHDYLYKKGDVSYVVYFATPGSPLAEGLAACGVKVGPSNDAGCVNDGRGTSFRTTGLSGQIDWSVGDHILRSEEHTYEIQSLMRSS